MASLMQPSFTAGELSPSLLGRIDLARYQSGLQTCRNFIIRQYGGVSNRPGTGFIHEVKDSSKKVRLIPFQFNTEQTYILEFGNLYMRVHKDGGTVYDGGSPVEIVTPYPESILDELAYVQSADVLTVCHQDYAPRQISRLSHTSWSISEFNNQKGPFKEINTTQSKVLYASASTGTVTVTASGFAPFTSNMVGDFIYLEQKPDSATAVWEVAKRIYQNDTIISDTGYYKAVSVNPADSVPRITGTVRPDHKEGNAWDGTGLLEGAVYRAPGASDNTDAYVGVEWEYLHSGSGIVQITGFTSSTVVTATVISYLPAGVVGAVGSGNYTHKWAFSAWSETEGYPSAVGYYNQRQWFGGTTNQPQTVWASAVNGFTDFGTSLPILDDEAITFDLVSREVNAIRHFIPLSELVLLTAGGEWLIRGDSSGAILPSTINAKAQGYGGSASLPPCIIGSTALYVQEKGNQVRSLGYSFEQDAFIGNDLTVLSSHLFENHTIVSWAYQKIPYSVIWCVRDDGVLLGLTYMREQEVIGWFRCDTDGYYESVACISEGSEDAVYFAVRRTVDGTTKRYVERMHSRYFEDVRDAKFLDSSLSYDGTNTTAITMTCSGGTNYDHKETFTLTASSSIFVSGDVGNEISYYVDNTIYRMRIVSYTSGTVVSVQPNRTIPVEYRSARTDWVFAKDQFSGLSHLEGKTVSILADGNVHPQQVVTSGSVTLDYCAGVVHIGLAYTSDFVSLPVITTAENIRNKNKLISKVALLCETSRGIFAGIDAEHLLEYKQRSTENYDQPIAPATGFFEINIQSKWDKNGVVMVRQSDPLPLTILSIFPEVALGGS